VGYHNKYLLGSLEFTVITGRALAKPKIFVGGQLPPAPRWLRPWRGNAIKTLLGYKQVYAPTANSTLKHLAVAISALLPPPFGTVFLIIYV